MEDYGGTGGGEVKRKIGIRFTEQQVSQPGILASGSVELYDVESGDAFDGLVDLEVNFSRDGVISVTAKLMPSVISTKV